MKTFRFVPKNQLIDILHSRQCSARSAILRANKTDLSYEEKTEIRTKIATATYQADGDTPEDAAAKILKNHSVKADWRDMFFDDPA